MRKKKLGFPNFLESMGEHICMWTNAKEIYKAKCLCGQGKTNMQKTSKYESKRSVATKYQITFLCLSQNKSQVFYFLIVGVSKRKRAIRQHLSDSL